MSDPVLIGRYQLENLLKNRIGFLFLNLSESVPGHELLAGSHSLPSSSVLFFIAEQGIKPDAPIVLICETGAISIVVARLLEENSFINVFVVEGGIEGLKANGPS
jgi:rhodanese-related sulfurtransferase